jgi:hypothetical protein
MIRAALACPFQLNELHLGSCSGLNDKSLRLLGTLIAQNDTLATLSICHTWHDTTFDGWNHFFVVLKESTFGFRIESLTLDKIVGSSSPTTC